jgi:hypothetical protein
MVDKLALLVRQNMPLTLHKQCDLEVGRLGLLLHAYVILPPRY